MSKKRILIIDDETYFTQMVKINLEDSGDYEVLTENDPERSVEATRKYRPDLILLDVIMPNKEGPDVICDLKNNDDLCDIPVIFLTATITREEVEAQKGSIAGHSFLAKPTTIDELVRCIEKKLEIRY